MMGKYAIENYLRPPSELWTAYVAAAVGWVSFKAPWALMMTPAVAETCAFGLFALAFVRGLQGWRVIRYQRNLRRLSRYTIPTRKLPVSGRKLFLGRGFAWGERHTQRLRDTRRSNARRWVEPSWLYRVARDLEMRLERQGRLAFVAAGLASDLWFNPVRPLPPVGGNPAIHGVEPGEHDVWMDLGERVGHTLVLGTTRVGKTRLLEVLVTQDIHRDKRAAVIVFDPKGDADLLRRMWVEAKRAGRADQFYLFHLGHPDVSARYNALARYSKITEIPTRTTGALPDQGNAAAFKEFAWRFTNAIAQGHAALGRRVTYELLAQSVNDIEPLVVEYCEHWLRGVAPKEWEGGVASADEDYNERTVPQNLKGRGRRVIAILKYVEQTGLYDPVATQLMSAVRYDRAYFDKIASALGPFLAKMTTGQVSELLSPDYEDIADERPILDWRTVIAQGGIVYVGLDALSDSVVASAVGNAMFSDLTSMAGYLYKHGLADGPPGTPVDIPPVILHADEFNELIGDEFIPLLNKAGGANFQVTAYTQTWSDVEARVGSLAKAEQIGGNFNTHIVLRVKKKATAEVLTDQLPLVEVLSTLQVSGASDSSEPGTAVDFSSTAEDRLSKVEVPTLEPSTLMELPKGQAFVLMEGGRLHKVRLPMFDATEDLDMPSSLRAVAHDMNIAYTTGEGVLQGADSFWAERVARLAA